MSLNSVQIYYQDCFSLAKTLCIKSEDSAIAINNYLVALYGTSAVDLTKPDTWKYYLNISGQYHITDTLMYVNSLDTLQSIMFTSTELQNNPSTMQGYQYGSRYYYTLLEQYPDQEQLILGILYPTDINVAISSIDNTILAYPVNLVDSQELSLINDLQEWIYSYGVRWDVRAYNLVDSLYKVAQLGIFYQNILVKILNLRIKYCKTYQACNFHIYQYLSSHQSINRYLEYLNIAQMLYLYRNILYIERHPGWIQTFTDLINELLTNRNIPIAEYIVSLTTIFIEYKSVLSFDRIAINPLIDTGLKNKYNFSEFLIKIASLAPGNLEIFNSNSIAIENYIQNSRYNRLKSKDLESAMLDYSDAVPHTLTDILLNEWLYLASTNQYNAIINFTDPNSLIAYNLTAIDSFYYMTYLFMKARGIYATVFPPLFVNKVLKPIKPSIQSMVVLTDSTYTDSTLLANLFLSLWPATQTVNSVDGFFNLCASIFELGLQEWYQVSGNGEMYHRTELLNMADYQYLDTELSNSVYTGINIQTWLRTMSLPDPTYTESEYNVFISSIWNAGTGLANKLSFSFAQIQTAMLGILENLSSYSIQVIQNINSTSIKMINWGAIRLGNLQQSGAGELDSHMNIEVLNSYDIGYQTVSYLSMPPASYTAIKDITINNYSILFNYAIGLNFEYDDNFIIGSPSFLIELSPISVNTYSNYSTLTATQASSLIDIYQNKLL